MRIAKSAGWKLNGRRYLRFGGELAVLYCFIFLYLAIAGGGPVSIDRMGGVQ